MPDVIADIPSALETIRAAPLSNLRSTAWLEHELLPHLGLGPARDMPSNLHPWCGQGLQSFQCPAQFAPYLVYLSGRRIGTYAEIGTYIGGTFIVTVEYLNRFQPITAALAIDLEITAPIRAYAALNPAVGFVEAPSSSLETRRALATRFWDLILIDGNHSEQGCREDYELCRDRARLIALHDTDNDFCPDVEVVWKRLTAALPLRTVREFHAQYAQRFMPGNLTKCMGIGVIDFDLAAAPG